VNLFVLGYKWRIGGGAAPELSLNTLSPREDMCVRRLSLSERSEQSMSIGFKGEVPQGGTRMTTLEQPIPMGSDRGRRLGH
jgi:hypothetical protein